MVDDENISDTLWLLEASEALRYSVSTFTEGKVEEKPEHLRNSEIVLTS